MFLWWCFCGGVVVFVWWCFCGGVFVVVFLWWCSCGGVFVVVWWCFCVGVFVVVFLWWCSFGGVQSTTKYYSSTTKYYSVLQSTPRYYKVYSSTTPVLQSTTPVLQSTTPVLQSTTPYYKVLLRTTKFTPALFRTTKNYSSTTKYYSVLQSTTPVLLRTTKLRPLKRRQNDVLPVLLCTTPVLQKLPKWSFRARLPQHFNEQCFQNESFARCFRQFSPKICSSLQFRAIDTPIPARGFIRQKQNAPRTTAPCIPKFPNVRFATAACAKMYESIDREPTRFAHTKMERFTTVLGDRHHVFTERVARRQMKFAFRYSFGRSTPRFYREGWPQENEICVSLQFWAIDTTFLARGLLSGWPSPSRPAE